MSGIASALLREARGGEPPTERGTILVTTQDHEVTSAAVCALATSSRLYVHSGRLVKLLNVAAQSTEGAGPADPPKIEPLNHASAREFMTETAQWVRPKPTASDIRAHTAASVPMHIVHQVLARGEWQGFRPLTAVLECPVLLPNGGVLERGGYDDASGLFLSHNSPSVRVPKQPTRDDGRLALTRLLDPVSEFPFASDVARAAWLAAVLTPFTRYAFEGAAPMFCIDKNVRGAGATLLADVCGLICTGRPLARTPQSRDAEEDAKLVLSLGMEGATIVLLDNVSKPLGNAALDAALTGTRFHGRVLGASRTASPTLRMTWYATGNNIQYNGDTIRRVLPVRLDSPLERPEERGGLRYPDLIAHVAARRTQLISAALTALVSYTANGSPLQSIPPWGSFHAWSNLVRGTLVWLGQPDPGELRHELNASCDSESQALARVLDGLARLDPECEGLTGTAILNRLATGHQDPEEALKTGIIDLCNDGTGQLPNSQRLGSKLRHVRGRWVEGRCLESFTRQKLQRWRVAECGNRGQL